jgi:hypothetical protein
MRCVQPVVGIRTLNLTFGATYPVMTHCSVGLEADGATMVALSSFVGAPGSAVKSILRRSVQALTGVTGCRASA